MGLFDQPTNYMTDALFAYIADREKRKQQAFENNQAVTREARLSEAATADQEIRREQLAGLQEQRTANVDLRNQQKAAAILPTMSVGQGLNSSTAGMLEQGGYGHLASRTPALQAKVPGVYVPRQEAAGPANDPRSFVDSLGYAGTPQQQARKRLGERTDLTPEQQKYLEAQEASGDQSIDHAMFQSAAGGKPVTQEVDGFLFERQPDGTWKKVAEGRPEGTRAGDRPYIVPVQTANGIVPFNTRTGQFDDQNRKDRAPGEGAQDDITRGQSVAYQLGELKRLFDPAWVGPLAGRYESMKSLLAGNEPRLIEMQTSASVLQNMLVNLRTGAAMSEPEARRILAEIPDVSLPPQTFVVKMEKAIKDYDHWLKNRSRLAFGRTTTGDIDAMTQTTTPPKTAAPGVVAPAPAAPASSGGFVIKGRL